jgi:DNA-binding MarR family transcriptional regulator
MVKKLDKIAYPPREDHVGARLWRLSELWKKEFDAEMVGLGHSYFGEARSNLIRYIGPSGVPQSVIVARMKFSKQAVQQLLDGLVEDGVVERHPDPADKRGKLIMLTQKGLLALHDANRLKRRIERDYEKRVGPKKFSGLMQILEELAVAIAKKK